MDHGTSTQAQHEGLLSDLNFRSAFQAKNKKSYCKNSLWLCGLVATPGLLCNSSQQAKHHKQSRNI